MTVLEGMYYELPAIVPNVGGITELVEPGLNGFQITYEELDLIAEEIKKMLNQPEYWGSLSKGSVQKRSDFSRDVFSMKISKLLQK